MERLVYVCALSALTVLSACGSDAPLPSLPNPSGRSGIDSGTYVPPRDGGPDTGVRDGGVRDTGVRDAGFRDSGEVDPIERDGGEPVVDSGTVDGGFTLPDSDGDGILDRHEPWPLDTDGDGTPDVFDVDADGDGILDRIEAGDTNPISPPVDTDGDGTPDFRDLDSDGDEISDLVEGTADPDRDGLGNYLDRDSDGDGLTDDVEGTSDPDGDGFGNYLDRDSDGDLLPDHIERLADDDGDDIPAFLDDDSDGDGIPDAIELAFDPDGDGRPAYLDLDSDGDGIPDSSDGLSDPDGDAVPAFLDTDSDNDGIDDAVEGMDDPDFDSIPSYLDDDSDGDTIADRAEGDDDPDGDGTPSYRDLDADGDGIGDILEAGDLDAGSPPYDHDFDGVPSFLDLDSDADGIDDGVEGTGDPDGDGIPSFVDIDADGDFVPDATETAVDTDNDGTPDYLDLDSDGDTIWDRLEGTADHDQDGTPDRLDDDSDGDGLDDQTEAGDADLNTMPLDTDGDGSFDFLDLDSDGDGLLDSIELGCPASTHRLQIDSDGDGFPDPAESAYGSDPCNNSQGIDDFYFELPQNVAMQDAPLDFTNTAVDRADLAINIDTTGSMGGEITNLRNSLTTVIVPGAQAVVPDPAFAVSSFMDYPLDPFGAPADGDLPFALGTRVTTDVAAVATAMGTLATHNGADLHESGVEALYQIASGAGTTWGFGSVPAFDSGVAAIPGVADGAIGGVGFRSGALPIVVHVTDAPSHFAQDYAGVPQITAASAADAQGALSAIGARVLTIASASLPRPADPTVMGALFEDSCRQSSPRFYGRIDSPAGSDVDWFLLAGAAAGQTLTAEVLASRVGSPLDSVIGVYDGTGTQLAVNDDFAPGLHDDSQVSVVLSGPGPFYVAVSAFNDTNFNRGGAVTSGFYLLEIRSGPNDFVPASIGCKHADHGDDRASATRLVTAGVATGPSDVGVCRSVCLDMVADDPLRMPYGIAKATGANIPPCAWDQFGAGRPAGCGPNECCTGVGGGGTPPDAAGQCPLAFEIDGDGAGIGQAVVTGIESLLRFATFSITTQVRGDPAALPVDTSCFINDVRPAATIAPNACAPAATINGSGFDGVVPGTALTFTVQAKNDCVPATSEPQLFRAFIDVVADGVTTVDTRDVIVIVPPAAPVF